MASESLYQHALEQVLGGTHRRMGLYGVSDITNDQFHAEIKIWSYWKTAVSQLLFYNIAVPREELRLYVFGDHPKTYTTSDINMITKDLQTFGITLYQITDISDTCICIYNYTTSANTEHSFISKEKEIIDLSATMKVEIQESLKSNEFIDLTKIAKWLNVRKDNLIRTLRRTYVLNIDYIIKDENPFKYKRGGNLYIALYVSHNCFKKLVMRSDTKQAHQVCFCFT